MPSLTVTKTIALVKKTSPQTQILILTAHLNSTEVQTLVSSGVAGYILKGETYEKVESGSVTTRSYGGMPVVEAIRTVAKGKTWAFCV